MDELSEKLNKVIKKAGLINWSLSLASDADVNHIKTVLKNSHLSDENSAFNIMFRFGHQEIDDNDNITYHDCEIEKINHG